MGAYSRWVLIRGWALIRINMVPTSINDHGLKTLKDTDVTNMSTHTSTRSTFTPQGSVASSSDDYNKPINTKVKCIGSMKRNFKFNSEKRACEISLPWSLLGDSRKYSRIVGVDYKLQFAMLTIDSSDFSVLQCMLQSKFINLFHRKLKHG